MTIARTYVDTPVLMALVCPEPESERALRWLGSCQWQVGGVSGRARQSL